MCLEGWTQVFLALTHRTGHTRTRPSFNDTLLMSSIAFTETAHQKLRPCVSNGFPRHFTRYFEFAASDGRVLVASSFLGKSDWGTVVLCHVQGGIYC